MTAQIVPTAPTHWATFPNHCTAFPAELALDFNLRSPTNKIRALIAVLLMGAIQLLSLGIIGEYLGRLFLEVKSRPIYVVEGIYEDGAVQPPKS